MRSVSRYKEGKIAVKKITFYIARKNISCIKEKYLLHVVEITWIEEDTIIALKAGGSEVNLNCSVVLVLNVDCKNVRDAFRNLKDKLSPTMRYIKK